MSGADEAETGRPRVGPYSSGAGAADQDQDQDQAAAKAAVNAETQMIPVLDTGPAVVPPKIQRAGADASQADVAKVRAIARRSAAALPALGEDGPREVPTSAKFTVERRRRAQGRASGEGSAPIEDADPSGPAAAPAIGPAPVLGQRVPGEWSATEPVPVLGRPEPFRAGHPPPPRRNVDDSRVDTLTDGVPVPAAAAPSVLRPTPALPPTSPSPRPSPLPPPPPSPPALPRHCRRRRSWAWCR